MKFASRHYIRWLAGVHVRMFSGGKKQQCNHELIQDYHAIPGLICLRQQTVLTQYFPRNLTSKTDQDVAGGSRIPFPPVPNDKHGEDPWCNGMVAVPNSVAKKPRNQYLVAVLIVYTPSSRRQHIFSPLLVLSTFSTFPIPTVSRFEYCQLLIPLTYSTVCPQRPLLQPSQSSYSCEGPCFEA
jgi:hypothetical protein